jgi:hypothetical protein
MPRTRIPFERPQGKKEARLIIIAAEGRMTERIYFEALAAQYHSTGVHVEIIDRQTDSSDPGAVFEALDTFTKVYELDEDDELWMVIDRDYKSWDEKQISEIARLCHQKTGFNLGLSNPAFEIWLLIHIKDIHNDYTEDDREAFWLNRKVSREKTVLKKELSNILTKGFNESNYDAEYLIKNVHVAIKRAREMDKKPDDRWPNYLGTRVYRLAENIIKGK